MRDDYYTRNQIRHVSFAPRRAYHVTQQAESPKRSPQYARRSVSLDLIVKLYLNLNDVTVDHRLAKNAPLIHLFARWIALRTLISQCIRALSRFAHECLQQSINAGAEWSKCTTLYPYNFVERLVRDHPDVGLLVVTERQQRLDGGTQDLRELGVLPDDRRAYPLDDGRAARHLLLPVVKTRVY